MKITMSNKGFDMFLNTMKTRGFTTLTPLDRKLYELYNKRNTMAKESKKIDKEIDELIQTKHPDLIDIKRRKKK